MIRLGDGRAEQFMKQVNFASSLREGKVTHDRHSSAHALPEEGVRCVGFHERHELSSVRGELDVAAVILPVGQIGSPVVAIDQAGNAHVALAGVVYFVITVEIVHLQSKKSMSHACRRHILAALQGRLERLELGRQPASRLGVSLPT